MISLPIEWPEFHYRLAGENHINNEYPCIMFLWEIPAQVFCAPGLYYIPTYLPKTPLPAMQNFVDLYKQECRDVIVPDTWEAIKQEGIYVPLDIPLIRLGILLRVFRILDEQEQVFYLMEDKHSTLFSFLQEWLCKSFKHEECYLQKPSRSKNYQSGTHKLVRELHHRSASALIILLNAEGATGMQGAGVNIMKEIVIKEDALMRKDYRLHLKIIEKLNQGHHYSEVIA